MTPGRCRPSVAEVEESADLPGSLLMRPAVSASAEGELSPLAEPGLQPAANIALVATSGDGTPEWRLRRIRAEPPDPRPDRRDQCTGRGGRPAFELADEPRGDDARVGRRHRPRVANAIFAEYDKAPATENLSDDSPAHTEDGHKLDAARHRPAVPADARAAQRAAVPRRLGHGAENADGCVFEPRRWRIRCSVVDRRWWPARPDGLRTPAGGAAAALRVRCFPRRGGPLDPGLRTYFEPRLELNLGTMRIDFG
jgi:hypothetical protein